MTWRTRRGSRRGGCRDRPAGPATERGSPTLPAALKATCLICKAEFFVEAVSTVKGGGHSTAGGKRYTLRCANGHEKTWVQGAAALSDPE